MVVKIYQTSPLFFKGNSYATKPAEVVSVDTTKTKGLENVTPDYMVKLPVTYKNTGITEFANGLKLYNYKLSNGYNVSIVPMVDTPSVVKTYVNVGSMDESENIKGISHFLEHMAFNGTDGDNGYKKLNTGDTFKIFDSLGGWCNASTNYAVTDYVNSLPQLSKDNLEEQIKTLAAMTENLSLTDEMIEKEKGPVTSEIDMILDDAYTLSMDQTVRTLYNIKSSADELVGGSVEHINNLTAKDVKDYYNKYYTPDNINIVVTGDVNPDNVIELIAKNFRSNKKSNNIKRPNLTPIGKTVRKDFISDKTNSAIITLGCAGQLPNDAKAKAIFEILQNYIYSTDVGLRNDLQNINAGFYIGYDKISANLKNPEMIYIQSETSEENSEKAIKMIYDKLSALKAPDEKKLNQLKEFLMMEYYDTIESSAFINTLIGSCAIDNDTNYITDYQSILNEITVADVQEYIDKYLDLNKAAVTVIHPNTTEETIKNNYNDAKNISFKGYTEITNKNNIERKTLSNNIDVGFYKTNNENLHLELVCDYKLPEKKNDAVALIYEYMHDFGANGMDENEFKAKLEEQNISIRSICSNSSVAISGECRPEKINEMFENIKDVLYYPNITEENLIKAKDKIKEFYKIYEPNSYFLYVHDESKNNPYYNSVDDILKNIDNVTLDDIINYHSYILENSKAIVVSNMPNDNVKNSVLNNLEKFNKVQENIYKVDKVFVPNDSVKVLQKVRNTSQADISKINKFKFEDSIENIVKINIIKNLLNHSSISLFNTLREKEQLAYSVSADALFIKDCGEVICNILTTTDNKDTGKKSYENVQKSIDGFNRQIQQLINSEYTEEDLQTAKNLFKSDLLSSTSRRKYSSAVSNGMSSKYGVEKFNQLSQATDLITREDIDKYAKMIFDNKSVYSIVASEDTLNANKEYFNNLLISE